MGGGRGGDPGGDRVCRVGGGPRVRAGLMHTAVALVALAVAWGGPPRKKSTSRMIARIFQPAVKERGLVVAQFFFFNLAGSSSNAADEAASVATRGWCERASHAVSRAENARSDQILKYERRTERAAHFVDALGADEHGVAEQHLRLLGRDPLRLRGGHGHLRNRGLGVGLVLRSRHGRVALRRGHGLGRSGV